MGNRLSEIDIITGNSSVINSDIGVDINAIGYNTLDNLIYGIETGTNNLIVVDSNGNIGYLGSILDLPDPTASYEVGTIDSNGHLFIMETGSNTFYTINVDKNSTNYLKLVDPTAGFILETAPFGTTLSQNVDITDWAISADDGYLYGVDSSGDVLRIDQFTGTVTVLTTTGLLAGVYGPTYSYSDGFIYATNNNTGDIYRIEITGNNADALYFSTDIITVNNDGASCLNGPVNTDYGDAPDTSIGTGNFNYRTLLNDNGPRHGEGGLLRLGNNITFETDGYQNSTATGDDIGLGIQDDGTTIPLVAMIDTNGSYSLTIDAINETGTSANLYVWIDFNSDGIFQTEEGQSVVVPSQVGIQNINFNFNVPYPSPIPAGTTFIRARLTTDNLVNTGGLTDEDTRSFGSASDGEVEDYSMSILDINKSVDKAYAEVGEVLTYTVTIDNPGILDVQNVFFIDSIPSGTTYNNNLFVSSIYAGVAPDTGITILNINGGETITISWEVLIGNTIPVPNPILNTGNVTPENGVGADTNTVSTFVSLVDIDIEKFVDKTYAEVGDTLTYTTVITNTGTLDLDNVIFTDQPPLETNFIPNTLYIDGVLQPFVHPASNVNLGPLAVGESITVSYMVVIPSLPNPPEIRNISTAIYEYTLGPGEPQRTSSKDSNEVLTYVVSDDLSITKYVDKSVAEVGDTLLYTLVLRNDGNVTLTNIVVTDIIPPETSFIGGSVLIDGVSAPLEDPVNGINIGTLLIGENRVISFYVTIDSAPVSMEIVNNASATYEYIVDPQNPPLTGSATSNDVITKIIDIDIVIEKVADKETASIGDTITYYFTIRNNGNTDVNNFIFTDDIPDGTLYIDNSFRLNGVVIPGANPVLGVNIGTILSGTYVNISFSVIVDSAPCTKNFVNRASGNFEYDLNGETLNESVESNTVTVEFVSFAFKQINFDGELMIPEVKPDIEAIIDFNIEIDLCSVSTIDVINGVSNEGQIIGGQKVRICGNIVGRLEYVALVDIQSVHFAHLNIPFCTFIIIDNNVDVCNLCPSIGEVEDIYYTKLDNRKIFANITLIIQI